MFTIYDWMCLNVAFFSLFSSRLKHLFFLFYADSYRRHLLHSMSLFCSAICAPVACVSSVVIILLWLFLLSYKCMRRIFFLCWLLNFYVHIHWAMACININNLNFVSAHLVGISSVHIYPLYELPSLCDIFFCFVSKIVFFFCFISFNSRNLRCFFLHDRISVATTMHWHWPWHWCSTQISNQRATKTVHILKKKTSQRIVHGMRILNNE